jgi:putative transcriptional regulator
LSKSTKDRKGKADMAIITNLDVMLAKRKMSLKELAETIGITIQNLSILKTGKAKAVRFTTLEAVCRALQCQPGDILEFRGDSSNDVTYLEDNWKRKQI